MAEFNKRELVVLAKRCFENSQFEDVINYMKEVINLGLPLNCSERSLIIDSFFELKSPLIHIEIDKNIDERLRNDLIENARMEIRNLCKNAIDLLKENPVEKDISEESIAHYKGFEALQYHNLTSYSQYYDDPDSLNKAHELFEEATIIANEWLNPAQ